MTPSQTAIEASEKIVASCRLMSAPELTAIIQGAIDTECKRAEQWKASRVPAMIEQITRWLQLMSGRK